MSYRSSGLARHPGLAHKLIVYLQVSCAVAVRGADVMPRAALPAGNVAVSVAVPAVAPVQVAVPFVASSALLIAM